MKFKEWLDRIIDAGLLCGAYQDKTLDAKSKKHLMDVVLDSNGVSYLCEMQAKGYPLPYETILREFGNYINGRYIAEFKNDKGNGYTSTIYCCYSDTDTIEIKTTATTILGCKSKVRIAENTFVVIYADTNCELEVMCPESSRVSLHCYGDAKITLSQEDGKRGHVDVIRERK